MHKSSWVLPLLFFSFIGCVPGEYYADTPPPAPQEDVVGVAPYPGAVYTNGYWGWQGGRHVWNAGRWERGRPGYTWRPHNWEPRGNRYAFRRGGWYRR